MAENVKKIAITTDNNHRQRNTMMEHSAYNNNVKKIAITNVTDNKLPLLKGIDQVRFECTKFALNNIKKRSKNNKSPNIVWET
jgi:hypothetical protein